MQLNLSCVVPLLIFVLVAIIAVGLMRRFVFAVDELAMVGLVVNGLRDVVGRNRFNFGCAILLFLAFGLVIMIILVGLSAGTCFSDAPSEFCKLFPIFKR